MNKSVSFVANRAISAFVEEHRQTHELVRIGLQLIDKGVSISESAIDEWIASKDDAQFPAAEIHCEEHID